MRVPAFLLLGLVLSGCIVTTTEVTYPEPACAPAYPDGSPKDCARDEAVGLSSGTTEPGIGWSCVHDLDSDLSGWPVRYELWRSDAGDWQAAIFGHGSGDTDHVVATFTLHAQGGPIAQSTVATKSDGLVALGPAVGVTRWTVWAYAFDATGAEIVVRATPWNDTTWFVYAAADGSWAQDGMVLPENVDYYHPMSVTVQVDGAAVVVETRQLIGKTGYFSQVVAAPGLGIRCDAPG